MYHYEQNARQSSIHHDQLIEEGERRRQAADARPSRHLLDAALSVIAAKWAAKRPSTQEQPQPESARIHPKQETA